MAEQDTQPEEPQEGAQGDESTTPDPESTEGADAQEADASSSEEPTTADYQEAKPQSDASTYADAEGAGYFGTLADAKDGDPNAVLTADQAAPEGADDEPAYFGMLPEEKAETAPVKLADLPDTPDSLQQTPETLTGYVGHVPTSDADREAMTLGAQAAKAREQYGLNRPESV